VRLVGVPEVRGDAGQVGTVAVGQPLGGLVQAAAPDQPLRRQPDPPRGEPLEGALGDRELLADLADAPHVGVALDVLDDGVDQQALAHLGGIRMPPSTRTTSPFM
jgi:hypothetical protein